jgi:glutamine synthetase
MIKMKISIEYVWIGGNGEFRSKIKILNVNNPVILENIPEWNFDGTSTEQASIQDSEVMLKPVKLVKSPFALKHYKSYLVLCEAYNNLLFREREHAKNIFDVFQNREPWFGLEQEYFLIGSSIPNDRQSQGPYYCGVGKGKHALEREIALEHLEACLKVGLEIGGIHAEVAHCQWEYSIGPCVGIDAGDQLLLSRYILERIAEKHGVNVLYDPKPFAQVNGSGCHVNFSTASMRGPDGLRHIEQAIHKLSIYHQEIIDVSGEHNERRLTGLPETSSMEEFTWGIGTKNTSIRIPNSVFKEGKGYLEDRRSAANINPYIVTSAILRLSV